MILALVLVVGLVQPAQAVPCDLVRLYVKLYGEQQAIRWAIAKGWSRSDIATARLCLRK
jgi:hypothetical protein